MWSPKNPAPGMRLLKCGAESSVHLAGEEMGASWSHPWKWSALVCPKSTQWLDCSPGFPNLHFLAPELGGFWLGGTGTNSSHMKHKGRVVERGGPWDVS